LLPGITIRWNIKNGINYDHHDNGYCVNSVLRALASVAYDEEYRQEILLRNHSCVVACNRYPNYPIKIFNDDNFWSCVEGRIYGKEESAVKRELDELLDYLFSDYVNDIVKENRNNKLVNWLLKTDGDFIIYTLNKKNGDLIIVNDVLGRLPIYYYDSRLGLIISREVQLIANLINDNSGKSNKFDSMAIAQYLLCGYTLGKRTLLRDVYRVEPGSLIRIHNYSREVKIHNVYCFNFEDKEYASESATTSASKLVSLFDEACRNRAAYSDSNKKNIVSLSGGFDSRCILVSLYRNKIPCSAVTVARPEWSPIVGNKSETEIAHILANQFGADWESFTSSIQPTAEDLCKLLESKQGLSYIGYSFLLPFLHKIREKYTSAIAFFTGHGGDILLPDLTPPIKLCNLDDLVNYIIRRPAANVSLPLSEVASTVGIDKSQIITEIRNILSSYPEKSLGQKYVHFLIYNGYFNHYNEREDRNRFYFWSVAPFYSVPFFYYAMNCSDKNKVHRALQKRFLFALSPSAAEIDKSDYGCSIMSKRYMILEYILYVRYRYPALGKLLRKITNRHGYNHHPIILRCLRSQIGNCEAICSYFIRNALENILNNSANYSAFGIINLFTVTSLMENAYCNTASIKKYYNQSDDYNLNTNDEST
jgi:asparagine synthase (glutamine-hydrolysing)